MARFATVSDPDAMVQITARLAQWERRAFQWMAFAADRPSASELLTELVRGYIAEHLDEVPEQFLAKSKDELEAAEVPSAAVK